MREGGEEGVEGGRELLRRDVPHPQLRPVPPGPLDLPRATTLGPKQRAESEEGKGG